MNSAMGRLAWRKGWRLLALCLLVAACPGTSHAQDEIHYYDRTAKAVIAVQATIEQESSAGLRFRTGARVESIDVPVRDLVDVVYSVPGSLRLILARARNEEKKSLTPGATRNERLQAIAHAIKEYEDLLNQAQFGALRAGQRHWQFRIARLRAQAASESPAEQKRAAAALTAVLRESDSWQTNAATRLLANCLADRGDFDAITPVYRQALNRKGLASAPKREQAREQIMWDCLAKNTKQASASLTAQKAETPPGSSEMLRLQALEALRDAAEDRPEKALSLLESLEKQAKEPADRGFVWLMRGYCESFAGRDDQALWAMLRVDQLYNEDRVAHALAVGQIVKLLEGRADWARAALYRAKLWRDFTG